MAEARVLTSAWYAAMLGPPCVSDDELLDRSGAIVRRLARGGGFLRGLATYRLAARFELLALVHGRPGTRTVVFLEALLRRRRRIVLLELIGRPEPKSRLKRALLNLRFRIFERPALARALLVGQVLTGPEVSANADRYRLPVDRFRFVPWAWCREGGRLPEFDPASNRVLASGRESCDWETTFAAARGRDWPLTIVCGHRDRERVNRLNQGGRARVLVEIPREEHEELLRTAAVYVLPLLSDSRSAGQVRLMSAVEEGAPVAATDVPALQGYVENGRTAILVPPKDPQRLREAIEGMLGNPEMRLRLREAAIERARTRTFTNYFADLRSLIEEQLRAL